MTFENNCPSCGAPDGGGHTAACFDTATRAAFETWFLRWAFPNGAEGVKRRLQRDGETYASPAAHAAWGAWQICGGLPSGIDEIELPDLPDPNGRAKMGVGTGDGNLFVYGDYDSIKAAQTIVLERDALKARPVLTDEEIDKRVDAVLRASGSGLRYFTLFKTVDAMRQAMREALK